MVSVDHIEVKIGNSRRLVLKDGVLQEKDLKVLERKQGIIADLLMVGLVYFIFGKTLGIVIGLNSLINRVIKLIV